MLPYTEHGSGPITLILMPFLGGSQREWTEVLEPLGKAARCLTLDLPGFGEAAHIPGYTISEMADTLLETLTSLRLDRYLLVGHGMSGKLAAVVTRRILNGDSPMHPPIGLVLVAPSPPSPEPMTDSKREEMLQAFPLAAANTSEDDVKQAEKYIRDSCTRKLQSHILNRTVQDLLKMNRHAWAAWLQDGSKEDWATRVNMVDLPTLIVAGDNDSALGPAAQAKHTEPHFPKAHLVTFECNHLIPIEEPGELAARISNFLKVL